MHAGRSAALPRVSHWVVWAPTILVIVGAIAGALGSSGTGDERGIEEGIFLPILLLAGVAFLVRIFVVGRRPHEHANWVTYHPWLARVETPYCAVCYRHRSNARHGGDQPTGVAAPASSGAMTGQAGGPRAARSRGEPPFGATQSTRLPATFRDVWIRTRLPQSSLMAFRGRRTGTLTVSPGRIVFVDRKGQVEIGAIHAISYGLRGTDSVNLWIDVGYRDALGNEQTIYIMDGGDFGWRAQDTDTNERILAAVRAAQESEAG